MTTMPWSIRCAETCITRYPRLSETWEYQFGVVLKGIEYVWMHYQHPAYISYIKDNIDQFVQPDGSIRTYRPDDFNLDLIHTGRLVFTLYEQTGEERYRKAIALLRSQLSHHPRTSEGGFWHKSIYPNQMWLDGIYMASPFSAQYAQVFTEPSSFDDVALQFELVEKHTRDDRTRLLFHGWDATRSRPWANPESGRSPNFWGRAIGWYGMALVDVLDYFPENHPYRSRLVQNLVDLAQAVSAFQDEKSGLWYQVIDQGNRAGNYLETSASCMFTYSIAKGVRQGYLAPVMLDFARKGYAGVLREKVTVGPDNLVDLRDICKVAGLSGTVPQPQRDGSYDYYIREPVVMNDYKGIGAFILASVEMEKAGWGS